MTKRNTKQKTPRDRHLDVPAEANRDKHINFLALENNDPSPDEESTDSDNREVRKNKKTLTEKRTLNPRNLEDTSTAGD